MSFVLRNSRVYLIIYKINNTHTNISDIVIDGIFAVSLLYLCCMLYLLNTKV